MADKQTKPSRRGWRALTALIVAAVAAVPMIVGATDSAPAHAAVGNPLAFTNGYTIVSFGDARLDNSELEGTLAVGGDVSFARGYPMVHSTGLTPQGYSLPVVDGHPTRLLVGNRFRPDRSNGVSQATSAGNLTDDQLGYVKIGDISNLAINRRSSAGVWISAAGTPSGTQPALEVTDRVNQPLDTVAAPGAFAATFAGAAEQAQAAALHLADLDACADAVAVMLEAGSHGGERRITLTPDATNVLTVTADQLGDYRIALLGATLGPSTTLVVNIVGEPSEVMLPGFATVTHPSATNPNTVAPYTVWNFGNRTTPVTIRGNLVSGSILAPRAAVTTAANSPLEGQIIAGTLVTGGGEIHHYAFDGDTSCDEPTPTTTTTVLETTTTIPETTTTIPETTTTVPETTTTVPETTTTVPEATTTTSPAPTTTQGGVTPPTSTTVPVAPTTSAVTDSTTTAPDGTTSTVPSPLDVPTTTTTDQGVLGDGGVRPPSAPSSPAGSLPITGSAATATLLFVALSMIGLGGAALLARRTERPKS